MAKTQPEDQSLQTPLPKAMFQSRWDHWSAKAIMSVSTFFVITNSTLLLVSKFSFRVESLLGVSICPAMEKSHCI